MKILVLSDVQRQGGAGIAAHRLAVALRAAGHEIVWACGRPDGSGDFATINYQHGPLLRLAAVEAAQRCHDRLGARLRGMQMVHRIQQITETVRPDVIHAHNLHLFNLPADLPARLSRRWPVVWTLHDMWAFTGTCAYSLGCRAFESGCTAACPLHAQYPTLPAAQVPGAFAARQRGLEAAGRLGFVTPSQWLRNEAQRGLLKRHPVVAIANCLDLEAFRPVPREAARRALGLPERRPIVFAASAGGDRRKGTDVLLGALRQLRTPEVTWLTLGRGEVEDLPAGVTQVALAPMRDDRLLALAYSAADVHVLPTRADNLPNTLLEAAACGTPSVASDVGGVGEVVVPEVTGWLAPVDDAGALAQRIDHALSRSDAERATLRQQCRAFAEDNFDATQQARAYEAMFERTIHQPVAARHVGEHRLPASA